MKRIKHYDEFSSLIKESTTIIISKTQNCNVCTPVTLRLIELMNNFPEIPLYELYIEDIPEFRGQHLVFTVPTIIVFYEGKEIHRESRFIDWEKLSSLIIKLN